MVFLFLLSLSFIAVLSESCRIYEEYDDGYYENITELGIAAIKNDAKIVELLVKSGCDVNFNGTSIKWHLPPYIYEDNYDDELFDEFNANFTEDAELLDGKKGSSSYDYYYYYYSDNKNESYPNYQQPDNSTYNDYYMLTEDATNNNAYNTPFQSLVGETALHIAVDHASTAVVQELTNFKELDVNAKSGRGTTALHDAASLGHSKIIKLLHSSGADLESRCVNGYTPLQLATMYGKGNAVKTLADLGADIDAVQGKHRETALITAVIFGEMDIVQLLVRLGADTGMKDKKGRTAMDWAKEFKDVKIMKLLQKNIKLNA